jgi:hypothetical protein
MIHRGGSILIDNEFSCVLFGIAYTRNQDGCPLKYGLLLLDNEYLETDNRQRYTN